MASPKDITWQEYVDTRFTDSEMARHELEKASIARFETMQHLTQMQQIAIEKIQDTYTREAEMEKAITAALISVDVRFRHVEDITSVLQTNVELRFRDAERATALATAALEKRLESMNEFRDQLRDQAAKFITRTEIEDKVAASQPVLATVNGRLGGLENARANLEGRMWAIGVFVTIISVAVSIAVNFLH